MSYASTQLLECPSQQAPVTFAFPPATQERLMSVFPYGLVRRRYTIVQAPRIWGALKS